VCRQIDFLNIPLWKISNHARVKSYNVNSYFREKAFALIQLKCICMALFTTHIVSKQLYRNVHRKKYGLILLDSRVWMYITNYTSQ